MKFVYLFIKKKKKKKSLLWYFDFNFLNLFFFFFFLKNNINDYFSLFCLYFIDKKTDLFRRNDFYEYIFVLIFKLKDFCIVFLLYTSINGVYCFYNRCEI
jgi:hypothetical protein